MTGSGRQRTCICDGTSGTDCFWCQGSGYISEGLRFPGTRAKQVSIDEQLNARLKEQRAAEQQSADVRDRKARIRRILNNTGIKKKGNTLNRPIAEKTIHRKCDDVSAHNANFAFCKDCKARVKISRLESHKKKCPVIKIIDQKSLDKSKVAIEITSEQKFVICDWCFAKLSLKNVTKHKAKCKKVSVNNTKSTQSPKRDKRQQPVVANRRNTRKNGTDPQIEAHDSPRDYRSERSLDGSRDFYSAKRDRGQFGSHSMFDDMGDESSA